MTVDDWVYEAVQERGKEGSTVRDIQKYIDEHHYEELAIDTIESSLESLAKQQKLVRENDRWQVVKRTSREDAMKKLFGEE